MKIEIILDEAAKRMGVDVDQLSWWSWPQMFGSTAGPTGGIGGCMMTAFQVVGITGGETSLMSCCGVWSQWDGHTMDWYWRKTK